MFRDVKKERKETADKNKVSFYQEAPMKKSLNHFKSAQSKIWHSM